MNKKFKLMRAGDVVVDLGAAPGGWSQVAKEAVGEKGIVIGIDLQEIEPIEGAVFIRGDVRLNEMSDTLIKTIDNIIREKGRLHAPHRPVDTIIFNESSNANIAISNKSSNVDIATSNTPPNVDIATSNMHPSITENAGVAASNVPPNIIRNIGVATSKMYPNTSGNVDTVISDMSPNISGHYDVDEARSVELCEHAFLFAKKVLKNGGNFVVKIFEGAHYSEYLMQVKSAFDFCKPYAPDATRPKSSEMYIVARDFIRV